MPVSEEFLAYMVDQLSGWGDVAPRRMFGGAGLFCQGAMFGLVADDVAYLKVDDSNRAAFEAAGSSAFQPFEGKKKMTMSYYEIPADVIDNRDELATWADESLSIAIRNKKEKP
jgi:DNA transformation protein